MHIINLPENDAKCRCGKWNHYRPRSGDHALEEHGGRNWSGRHRSRSMSVPDEDDLWLGSKWSCLNWTKNESWVWMPNYDYDVTIFVGINATKQSTQINIQANLLLWIQATIKSARFHRYARSAFVGTSLSHLQTLHDYRKLHECDGFFARIENQRKNIWHYWQPHFGGAQILYCGAICKLRNAVRI